MGVLVEKLEPDEVFAVLSDDNRVDILQALWEADSHEATFSELREAVGMRDSGKFNYHLDKLVGIFVSKSDDGYTLTQAGRHIYGTIRAGAYTMEATVEPISLPDPCPTCGGTYVFEYEDESVSVECDSCSVSHSFGMPPGALATYDRAEIPAVASQFLRTMVAHLSNGFCWFCDGRVEPAVGPISELMALADDDDRLESDEEIPIVQYTCQRCGTTPTIAMDSALLEHPSVVSFYYERGIDVTEHQLWNVTAMRTDRVFIRDRDPFRASVTYRRDGDELTVVVDESFDVVEIQTGDAEPRSS